MLSQFGEYVQSSNPEPYIMSYMQCEGMHFFKRGRPSLLCWCEWKSKLYKKKVPRVEYIGIPSKGNCASEEEGDVIIGGCHYRCCWIDRIQFVVRGEYQGEFGTRKVIFNIGNSTETRFAKELYAENR